MMRNGLRSALSGLLDTGALLTLVSILLRSRMPNSGAGARDGKVKSRLGGADRITGIAA